MMKYAACVIVSSLLVCVCSGLLSFPPPPQHAVAVASQRARRSPSLAKMASSAAAGFVEDSVSSRQLVSQGMEAFRKGDVQGSIALFDRADAKVPDGSLTPFLWQRGLSYYYAEQFEDASKQFRIDVKVNPLDVEEIVWDIASLSRLTPSARPPPAMMSLPKGKTDRRKIMGVVYDLFRGDATELDLATAGHDANMADEFYSLFYLGLFCETRGETTKAANYMKQAVETEYATNRGRGDYMTSCARVHCQLRGWS